MQHKPPKLFLACFLGWHTSLFSQSLIDMPGLTDPNTLAGAQEFLRIYSSYAQALAKYYGRATVLTSHLTFPFGQDNMGTFPAFYAGLGLGTAFANTQAIREESDPSVTADAVPDKLPTLGITLNTGMALTPRWDLRVAFFPPVTVSIPSAGTLKNLTGSVELGHVRARLNYVLKKDAKWTPGVSVAGFFFYNTGKITLQSPSITTTSYSYNAGIVNTFTYDVSTTAQWKYGGLGAEIKAWWNLVFIFPYVGFSLDMQSGSFTSNVTLNGSIQITAGLINETSSGRIVVDESAKIPFFGNRFILGFELNLILARLGVELQTDLNTRILGIGLGAGFQF